MLPGTIKTMGRAPRADFIVDAPLVSRLHCRLTLGRDRTARRRGSRQHQRHVGQRTKVKRAPLMAGDKLKVGRVEFAVGRRIAAMPDEPEADSRLQAHFAPSAAGAWSPAHSSTNGFVRRSSPIVVSGPWPGVHARVVAEAETARSVIDRISVS